MGPRDGPLGSTRKTPREDFPESSCAETDPSPSVAPSDKDSDAGPSSSSAAKDKLKRDAKATKDQKKAESFEFIRPRKPAPPSDSKVEYLTEQLLVSKKIPSGTVVVAGKPVERIVSIKKKKVRFSFSVL